MMMANELGDVEGDNGKDKFKDKGNGNSLMTPRRPLLGEPPEREARVATPPWRHLSFIFFVDFNERVRRGWI